MSGRFYLLVFGQENLNTKTRLLLWSTGFPEHSSYRRFFPSCTSRQGREKNKLLSVRAKQALICAQCSGAAFLLASGGVTFGIWGWNVFGMRQEVRSTQCEKNTTGSFLIVAQTACPHLSVSLPRLCLLPSLSVSQIKNQPCSHNSQMLQLSFC